MAERERTGLKTGVKIEEVRQVVKLNLFFTLCQVHVPIALYNPVTKVKQAQKEVRCSLLLLGVFINLV